MLDGVPAHASEKPHSLWAVGFRKTLSVVITEASDWMQRCAQADLQAVCLSSLDEIGP